MCIDQRTHRGRHRRLASVGPGPDCVGVGWLIALALIGTPVLARAQQDNALTHDRTTLPPAGFGTLRQEDVAIQLQTLNLMLRIIPLDERVIRLLSPDTYESLHRLRETRDQEIHETAQRFGVTTPSVFLVTFFGLQDRARFEPEILSVTSQNRLFRPLTMLPLSTLWSGRQLNQRETATAIYFFEEGIRLLDPFVVSYADESTAEWDRIVRVLDRERASVLARAARREEGAD